MKVRSDVEERAVKMIAGWGRGGGWESLEALGSGLAAKVRWPGRGGRAMCCG